MLYRDFKKLTKEQQKAYFKAYKEAAKTHSQKEKAADKK